MDQQSAMPMGQTPVPTVYMAGEGLVVPEPLTADQMPEPTVYMTGEGLVVTEPLTADQMPEPTVYMVGEGLVVPKPLTADQMPGPTVDMAGGGLVKAEPLTSNYKDIIEDQLIQVVESGGQACGLELGCQENNADLNQYPSLPAMPPAPESPEVTTKLQVIKSTEFKTRNTHIKEYSSRSKQRGMMVMFSYSEFITGQEYRDIDSDREMVIDLFSQLSIRPFCYTNLSKVETLEVMKALSPAGYDCLFILVSSHGFKWKGRWDTEFICSNGGLIPVYDVVDIFNNVNRPELAGVPKVFIFQMCRGSKSLCDQSAATDAATTSSEDADDRASAAAARCERRYSDVLIAYSTPPGYESLRNVGDAKGSLYMKALCKVFSERAHDCHVIELFQLVDDALRKLDPFATAPFESQGFWNLYLHPGLFEDAEGNATEM